MIARSVLALAGAVVVLWGVLVIGLWLLRPDARHIKDALRLLPDVARLIARLARDRTLPRLPRIALWGLLVYLLLPIDLIPDFLPVIGVADDAIVLVLVLRLVARRVGATRIHAHWRGTAQGFITLTWLAGLAPSALVRAECDELARTSDELSVRPE